MVVSSCYIATCWNRTCHKGPMDTLATCTCRSHYEIIDVSMSTRAIRPIPRWPRPHPGRRIPCRRMILSRLAWSARPSASAVRVTCHSLRSSAATTIRRSASALSSWNVPAPSPAPARSPSPPDLGRHVLGADHVAVGGDDHPLDHVAQLAHVVPRASRSAMSSSSASGASRFGRMPNRAQIVGERTAPRARGCRDSRSRSGGTAHHVHVEPEERSSRKRPAATSASRSRLVAATTRASTGDRLRSRRAG